MPTWKLSSHGWGLGSVTMLRDPAGVDFMPARKYGSVGMRLSSIPSWT